MAETIEHEISSPQGELKRKTPIVIQSGMFQDVRALAPLAEALSQRGFKVHRVGLPGHGGSTCDKGELRYYNLEDYVGPLAHRISRTRPRPIVVTQDVGALTLLKILEDRKERAYEVVGEVPAAVFLSPLPPRGFEGMLKRLKQRHPIDARVALAKQDPNRWIRTPKLVRELFVGPNCALSDDELFELVQPESWQVIEKLKAGIELLPLGQELPLQVHFGDHGACFAPEAMGELAQQLGGEAVVHPGAGHWLAQEPCLPQVAERIAAFADSLELP